MIGELFSGPEHKPIGYILSNSKSLIYLVKIERTLVIL
jgi:hypothetical protein